jgi:hypothetical protein
MGKYQLRLQKATDRSAIQRAFIVPLLCYVYVLYFAVRGYRPVTVEHASGTVPLGVEAE